MVGADVCRRLAQHVEEGWLDGGERLVELRSAHLKALEAHAVEALGIVPQGRVAAGEHIRKDGRDRGLHVEGGVPPGQQQLVRDFAVSIDGDHGCTRPFSFSEIMSIAPCLKL